VNDGVVTIEQKREKNRKMPGLPAAEETPSFQRTEQYLQGGVSGIYNLPVNDCFLER
jgi:hypothetical protein